MLLLFKNIKFIDKRNDTENMNGIDVAKYVIDKCCRDGKSITLSHLQKILYLIQGEYYSKIGSYLIDDDFWIGIKGANYPVLKEVNEKYRWYYNCRICETHDIKISEEDREIIDPIIELRRKQSAGALTREIFKNKKYWKDLFKMRTFPTVIPQYAIAENFVANNMKNETHKKNHKGERTMEIKIKYFTDKIEKLRYIDGKSDWIDLRAAEDVTLEAGEFCLIPLGIAMQLPKGYEAHIVPRSSTFKNFGVLQTNHMGLIDETYCGDGDQWHFPAYALRDTEIHVNDRICQFRIIEHQPKIEFEEVEILGNSNRGGIGSTGMK